MTDPTPGQALTSHVTHGERCINPACCLNDGHSEDCHECADATPRGEQPEIPSEAIRIVQELRSAARLLDDEETERGITRLVRLARATLRTAADEIERLAHLRPTIDRSQEKE
jgi:hypothetical protein